jgi:capsular polysaccharide transport system permease protein
MVHSILQHQRKSKLGYFWELIDPMIEIGVWFAIFTFLGGPRVIYDMNLFLFLSTGIVSLFFFQKIAAEVPGSLRGFRGFVRFTSLNQTDTLIAGALLEAVLMTIVSSILFSTIILGGFGFAPANPIGVIASLACLAALGFGFGWFNSMFVVFIPIYGKILPVLKRIIFITSGAIFPLENIPPSIFQYLQWNPVYQGIDLMRSEWSFTHESTTSSDGYVLLFAACLLLFGMILQKPARRVQTA